MKVLLTPWVGCGIGALHVEEKRILYAVLVGNPKEGRRLKDLDVNVKKIEVSFI